MKKEIVGIITLCLVAALFSDCSKFPKRSLIVGKLRKVAKLSTMEFVFTKIILAKKEKKIFFKLVPLHTATFLAYTEATITTGIDLDKLKHEDISIKGKSISLTLPPIEVTNFSYPAEKFHLVREYSVNQFWNGIDPEEQEDLFRKSELNIRASLKYLGIIKTTEDRTRLLVSQLLKKHGFEEVYIIFKKSKTLLPEVKLSGEGESK